MPLIKMQKDLDFFKDLTKEEIFIIKKLNTPKKIQDFLDTLKMNFEPKGDTCFSPRTVLKLKKAHCIEGALLAAIILRFHGQEPLIVDLESNKKDFDHVIAIFKKDGFFGSISKTNHAVLRYREPIYKNLRELVMSFFHEYFLNENGEKTLRSYSKPVNLKIFDNKNWITWQDDVWFIPEYLTKIKHYKILTKKQILNLRKADKVEISAGKIVEYKEKN